MKLSNLEVTVLSIGGNSYLASFQGGNWVPTFSNQDVSTVTMTGERKQTTKQGGTLKVQTVKATAGDANLAQSRLDVSSISIGGVEYKTHCKSGSFEGTFSTFEQTTGDIWQSPQHSRKLYRLTGDFELLMGTATNMYRQLQTILGSTDPGDKEVVVTLVVDGVTITVPMILDGDQDLTIDPNGPQMFKLNLSGNCPAGGGTYPTAPTSGSTLLHACILTPNTPLALAFSNASGTNGGNSASCNGIVSRFKFNIGEGEILRYEYDFRSQGAITYANAA